MTPHSDDPHDYKMGIMEHLKELRKRIFVSLVAILLGAVASYYYSGEVFQILCAPYTDGFSGAPLIGTSPAEAWLLKVKVALFCGCLVTSPFLFYQVWAFIAPGLYANEKRWVVPFVIASSALFIGGAAFCYTTVLPITLAFFRDEFSSINVTPTIRIGDHVSMTLMMLLGFGAVFELPLITLVLARFGVIDHHFLIRWYRQAILIIFIISAIITPPDVLSQMLMAVPLLCLYAISILIAKISFKLKTSPTAPKLKHANYPVNSP
jgi:sec-independent protein translocase protein TatC